MIYARFYKVWDDGDDTRVLREVYDSTGMLDLNQGDRDTWGHTCERWMRLMGYHAFRVYIADTARGFANPSRQITPLQWLEDYDHDGVQGITRTRVDDYAPTV